jgi:hypothetical protein
MDSNMGMGKPKSMNGVYLPACCTNPTVVSVKSGPWSDPTTWSTGKVPAAGDVASVAANTTVTYDVVSGAALDCVVIQSGGKLTFRTDVNTRLTVGTLGVLDGGTLEVGTTANPVAPNVTADIVIADEAIDLSNDPDSIGTGVIGFGTVHMAGATKTSFLDLAAAPRAGDTQLVLSQAPTGWKAGDRLILPDSRQIAANFDQFSVPFNQLHWEAAVISAINGTTVTLATPLAYDHPAALDANGVPVAMPDVADMTRNVDVRSANPNGTRGHMIFTGRADVDIEYVQLKDLGRSLDSVPVDQTTYDAMGNVVSYATNQIGRYPIHMHHLTGPATPQPDGYQFTIVGDAVDGGDSPNDHKWGIVVHGSSYGLIKDNVVYNTSGAGVTTEDGSEVGNVFDHNFVVRTAGTGLTEYNRMGGPTLDIGHAGDGFWFSGPDNIVRNNVAADSFEHGFNYYVSEFQQPGVVAIPLAQGDDPMMPGQSQMINRGALPFGVFDNNEAYSASQAGLAMHFTLGESSNFTVNNLLVWNSNEGFEGRRVPDSGTFNNVRVYGDPTWENNPNRPTVGINFKNNGGNVTVNNATVEGVAVGIEAPTFTTYTPEYIIENEILRGVPLDAMSGNFTVSGATFKNNLTDVRVDNSDLTEAGSPMFNNRTVLIENSSFSHTPTPGYLAIDANLDTTSQQWDDYFDFRRSQQVLVTGFDRTAGNDFQVFFPQQAANAVMPQTTANLQIFGSPVAGLTNAQNWATYGIATGGQVAPSGATAVPGIRGLVAPIQPPAPGANKTPPVISNVQVSQVANNSVTVTWHTSEPTISRIGFSNAWYQEPGAPFSTDHTVVLNNVYPNVKYPLTVLAYDDAGNIGTAAAAIGRTTPPVVSNITTASSPPSTVTISWNSDVPANGYINFGTTTAYGSTATQSGWSPASTNLSIPIAGLNPFTVYHYQVVTYDVFGNQTVSADRTFQVMGTPQVVGVGSPGFSTTGPWSPVNWYGDAYATHASGSGAAAGSATWTFSGLAPGDYFIFGNYIGGSDKATDAPYTVTDGAALNTKFVVNQQAWSNQTIWIGTRFYMPIGKVTVTGTTLTITLSDAEAGTNLSVGNILLAKA